MVRIGLIGCGGISKVHSQVIHGMEDAQLAACADILPDRAQATADKYGCAAYTDYLKMLDNVHPDAVHLCTPHYLHPVMAEEAARRGIAVFTEKPPAIDEAGWQKILWAAKRVPVGVCFQNRYNPNVLKAQEILRQGTYGRLKGIRAFVTWHRTADYYTGADWKGNWATEGGGALINQAIHTLDLVVRFLGKVDRAEAAMANHHLKGVIEVEDTAEIYMENGDVPALLFASTAHCANAPVMIELTLEQAVLRLEEDSLEIRQGSEREMISCSADTALGLSYWGAGHTACIRDFYRCVRENKPFGNDPASCEETMKALFAIYAQGRKML